MRIRLLTLSVVLTVTPWTAPRAQDIRVALEIGHAMRAAASRAAWPGFDPATIPLAIYDGQSTSLFRHPSPPSGFARASIDTSVMVMRGRHPAMTANSSAAIGGRSTATLMADNLRAGASAESLAAVALHEMFHVFQRARHKGWVGNEGDLLTYPSDDARRLALRRLETDALRRAQDAVAADSAACWAHAYLNLRRARYAGLDSIFTRYERLTELNEGLASYMQAAAAGEPKVVFPAGEFAPAAVRLRIYTTGPAMAQLLDRFDPRWKESLERDDAQTLDGMLARALPESMATCAHSEREREAERTTAVADSAALVAGRVARRTAFDTRSGWRLVVHPADGEPLWPQGFDPLNVEHVAGGTLHTRYLKLGNEAGTIEILDEVGADIEGVTVAAGSHPLFNGVRELIVAGLAVPEVRDTSGVLIVSARGLRLSLRGAAVRTLGQTVHVTLAPRPR